MTSRFVRWSITAVVAFHALTAVAHLNSPDIYVEENAGPYPLTVIVRMPPAVPGSAEVQVLVKEPGGADHVEVWVREIPPEGEQQAPAWSRASADDLHFFRKALPLMETGMWRAQIRVKGNRGEGIIEIPVSARIASPKVMRTGIAAVLVGLIALLYSSGYQLLVGLGRDALRKRDEEVSSSAFRKGRIFAAIGLTILSGYIGILAYVWYLAHINTRSSSVPPVIADFKLQSPTTLEMSVNDSDGRPLSDLQPDHGKLVHLFIVDVPQAKHFFHLHPQKIPAGRFLFHLPPSEPGRYKVFADLVRSSGDAETVTANIDTPSTSGRSSPNVDDPVDDPDDSSSSQPAFGTLPANQNVYPVGNGCAIRWTNRPQAVKKGEFHRWTFELADADGKLLDLQPYMGMDGHLLVMRADEQIFAHVHPMGTLPGLAMPMSRMADAHSSKVQVSFPYGFPDKGSYRLWVQLKHDRVLTGVFDVEVR